MKFRKTIIFGIILFSILSCQKETKYKFSGEDLCNDEKGMPTKFITEDDINKFGIRKIFDKKEIKKNDSIIITFKIIDDCCQEPTDSVKIENNEMIIFPKFKDSPVCDCYCDYLFEYKFHKKYLNNKSIKIKELR